MFYSVTINALNGAVEFSSKVIRTSKSSLLVIQMFGLYNDALGRFIFRFCKFVYSYCLVSHGFAHENFKNHIRFGLRQWGYASLKSNEVM